MNIPLSWFFNNISNVSVVDHAVMEELHHDVVKRAYTVGFLKKGDRYSLKDNKKSFSLTRYRKEC